MTDISNAVLAAKLKGVEDTLVEIKVALAKISDMLLYLARLDEKHTATVVTVARQQTRLEALESANTISDKLIAQLALNLGSLLWFVRVLTVGLVTGVIGVITALIVRDN